MVTKPGYSSFCEALTMGVGIHLVHRDGFAEAPVLEAALVRHGWHYLLSRAQALAGDWRLDQPLIPPSDPPLPVDGCMAAAKAIEYVAANRVVHSDLNRSA